MTKIILVAHNVRSTHNVGSLLRTAEGLGARVYLTGYTPYPSLADDTRLPHVHEKLTRQIRKTALGAETSDIWQHQADVFSIINDLHGQGYTIAALEQTPGALQLPSYKSPEKLAIIVGREVEGVEPEIIAKTDLQLVIPMFGQKESFNVAQAAAMALYHCRFYAKQ
jgi:tRNA G18 (ribose-2'-O)-methylase SpoU